MANKLKIEIYGVLNNISFVKTRCCAEDIYKQYPDNIQEPIIGGMLEFDWNLFIDEKKRELRGEAWVFSEKTITFANGELIGGPDDFNEWAQDKFNFDDFRPLPLYFTLTEEGYKEHLNSKKHDYVYMDISIEDEDVGRLVIELFSDCVPKTCANFKALCTGEKGISEETGMNLTFKNSIFHRLVPNGWIQGGDFYHGRGNGGESVYGSVFEDENFSVPHNRRGILGMANKGRHTNGSQFYITLQPTQWMDTKYVAFGQIIEGTETLRRMETEKTMNERPVRDIKIHDCGVLTFEF
ncbi:hypothetical protein C0Q70_10892 [Pomacea canaliculata]|uniref:Peptidyl-prolyl cis-trans isomerase n=2 Tax=Pomacea canaliculata TaxID=400727 RepID=A0A2T7P4F1_POMCA|nr:hypothetical protein C0Q70_10892 [Pomacea canaliculata]